MKRRRFALFLVLCAMTASACGARLSSSELRTAEGAQLGGGGGTGTNAVGTNPGGTGNTTVGGSTSNNTSSSRIPGTTTNNGSTNTNAATPRTGATSQSTVAASPPPGGNGGATDVGVTGNSITLGNVSSLTGPVPGLFEGAVIGAQAYFSYINSQGGIYGRNLYLDAKDDQTTCSGNENQTTGLAGQVFGFVGSFSLYDNCGAAYLANHTGIPDASYGLSTDAVDLKNDFSIDPIKPGGYYTGAFLYWKSKYGAAVQQVGSVYPNIASAADQQLGIQKAAESVGWHWDYSQPEPATQTDFTSDVIQMKAKGVKIVYIVAENTQNTATIVENIQQQNWNPIIISPVAYGGGFVQIVKQGGANPAGIQGGNLYSMFGNFPQNDASTIPEVALYQTWMQRQNPNQLEDLYSMFSWAEAALFVQALKAAGPHVTRAAVMAQLQKVTSFNDNGMVAPANPAGKVPAHCYVLWQINNNDNYVRVDTPPGQFRCDGSFFYG